jgi:hypothetical protein
MPITVAERSKTWTVLARSNTGILGSNRSWGMDVCMRLFCVEVDAFRRTDPPSKQSYRPGIGLGNWKLAKIQQKTVEPYTDR